MITLEEFMKKVGIKNTMAGVFWYRQWQMSNLTLDEWIQGKEDL